jgi:hypothetical protein
MVKCNIFPKKFANGSPFSVAGLRYISKQAVLTYIRENDK